MVICALVHPPTLASPNLNPNPPRGRGPWFFVVLIVALLSSIAAGAVVVLVVGARVPVTTANGLPSASAPAVSAVAAASRDAESTTGAQPLASSSALLGASARPTLAPGIHGQATGSQSGATTPGPSTAIATTQSAGKGTLGCMCRGKDAMCPKDRLQPSQCSCKTVPDGYSLCPDPWTASGCPRERAFGNTNTAKEGDPCTGYNSGTDHSGKFTNEHMSGRHFVCSVCAYDDLSTFGGKEGSACVGYTTSRVPIAGVVDCSNLAYACKRNDDPAACAALATHK
jgi:hypothetical protein